MSNFILFFCQIIFLVTMETIVSNPQNHGDFCLAISYQDVWMGCVFYKNKRCWIKKIRTRACGTCTLVREKNDSRPDPSSRRLNALLGLGRRYRWPNGSGLMGQHGHDPKKHGPSTARARHHSASVGTRHDLDSAWPQGRAAALARARHD
jgi:hypothetical protein